MHDAATRDVAHPTDASELETDVPDVFEAPDTGPVDPYFDKKCQQLPHRDCGPNDECVADLTNGGHGFDAGVEMYGHCSFECSADADCLRAGPGARCVPYNDGYGNVGGGVCAPPAP